jgi:hypothetical protein
MFLRMIRGEEKSHATKKKKALKHCVSQGSLVIQEASGFPFSSDP